MTQHTPGPWFISGVRVKATIGGMRGEWHGIGRYDEDNKKDDMFVLVSFDPKTGLGWADAKLIAAAPQLWKITKGFRQKLATYVSVYPGDKELRQLLAECDAAIKEAEEKS